MNYLQLRIKSWRLPRAMLFSFAGLFIFLALFTLQDALNPEIIAADQAVIYHGKINSMRRSYFKSSLLLTFEIEGFCSELVCPGFKPFHYQEFSENYSQGMSVEFVIRKSEQSKLDSCQRCEIVALSSGDETYLTLLEHNRSSYTAKRIVAGGVAGALFTAGIVSLLLALLSAKTDDELVEIWERKNVFRRKLWK